MTSRATISHKDTESNTPLLLSSNDTMDNDDNINTTTTSTSSSSTTKQPPYIIKKKIKRVRRKTKNNDHSPIIKYGSLILLVAQLVGLVMLMRYSRTHTNGKDLYLPSTAVFCMEVSITIAILITIICWRSTLLCTLLFFVHCTMDSLLFPTADYINNHHHNRLPSS